MHSTYEDPQTRAVVGRNTPCVVCLALELLQALFQAQQAVLDHPQAESPLRRLQGLLLRLRKEPQGVWWFPLPQVPRSQA